MVHMDSSTNICMDNSQRPTKPPNNKSSKLGHRMVQRRTLTKMTEETENMMRTEMITIMRMIQILLLIMIITNLISWWYPMLSIANIITAILGLYFEQKIEKKIKKKIEENKE